MKTKEAKRIEGQDAVYERGRCTIRHRESGGQYTVTIRIPERATAHVLRWVRAAAAELGIDAQFGRAVFGIRATQRGDVVTGTVVRFEWDDSEGWVLETMRNRNRRESAPGDTMSGFDDYIGSERFIVVSTTEDGGGWTNYHIIDTATRMVAWSFGNPENVSEYVRICREGAADRCFWQSEGVWYPTTVGYDFVTIESF